jgi:hypothetical protein
VMESCFTVWSNVADCQKLDILVDGGGYSHLGIPMEEADCSRMIKSVGEGSSMFPSMEHSEVFQGAVPHKVEQSLCSEDADLGSLAARLIGLCTHAMLVKHEWMRYSAAMVSAHAIKPRIEHYGRMVDILARAGFIEQVLYVVVGWNCHPHSSIWRSRLDASCKRNAGPALSEAVAKLALAVPDDAKSGIYVSLSRIDASAQRCVSRGHGIFAIFLWDPGGRISTAWGQAVFQAVGNVSILTHRICDR